MAERPGVCTPWAELSDLPCSDVDATDEQKQQALQFASDVLFDFTGRRWPGLCMRELRPCAERRNGDPGGWWPVGSRRGGMGACSCNRSARCGCSSLSEVRLADHVVEVVQVLVDGVVVPPVEYALDEGKFLVGLSKADGSPRVWPCCQRLDLETTEPGTWEVTAVVGQLPPIGGKLAAASLACELLRALTPDQRGCRLPKRVTTITRQGVSLALLDPLTLFRDGATGVSEVDLWLGSVARGDARRRGRLIVPGRRGGHSRERR